MFPCSQDAVLVENMHDLPYLRADRLGPEVTACMTRVAAAVRRHLPATLPVGVQVRTNRKRRRQQSVMRLL